MEDDEDNYQSHNRLLSAPSDNKNSQQSFRPYIAEEEGALVPHKQKFRAPAKNFKEDLQETADFEPARGSKSTTFLGGIFDKVRMQMSQSAFRIMPKSDDEADLHQLELQRMMDLPDGILRQKLDI